MRLWTLHPRYLDSKGLVAAWREALLAQKVLYGGTRGYRSHPQLFRFRSADDPKSAIAAFLLSLEMYGLGLDYDVRLPGMIGQVTLDQANAAATRLLDPARATIAVAGPWTEPAPSSSTSISR